MLKKHLLNYCMTHYEKANLSENKIKCKYEEVIKYLLNNKFGTFSIKEARFIIYYFAKVASMDLEVNDGLKIEVLPAKKFIEQYGADGLAICCENYDESTYTVAYSTKLINSLLSSDIKSFLKVMRIICHEIVHVLRYKSLKTRDILTSKVYIMALEMVVREVDIHFYKRNYVHLLSENDANKIGLKMAVEYIKKYSLKLFEQCDLELVKQEYEKYDDNFFKSQMTIFNHRGLAMKQMDLIASNYIAHNPKLLEEFPILQVAYGPNGRKKNIKQLLIDRAELLKRPNVDVDKINDLYLTVANEKNFFAGGLTGVKDEVFLLCEYIYDTSRLDKFILNLLIFRFQMLHISDVDINNIISNIKNDILYSSKKKQGEKI